MKKITLDMSNKMIDWRHAIHANPETKFDVYQTASFVAKLMRSWGIEVHENIGQSGIVGVLKKGSNPAVKAIALRADLDAIPIQEMNSCEYKSCNDNKMHACGHDGHTAMLLGAAYYLAESGDFEGTVNFIFQPDEENGTGASAMINDGLFERFPVSEIYGMHNVPGQEAGTISVAFDGVMASETLFEITINGQGGHASSPHLINDPVVVSAQIINSLQTIVSRCIDPLQSTVVSITEILTDGARNVVPSNITIKGDYRTFSDENVVLVHKRMIDIVDNVCAGFNMTGNVEISKEFLVSYNTKEITLAAIKAAKKAVGEENVNENCPPKSFSEDFAHFAKEVPACYVFIGNGTEGQHSLMLHNPEYDFNDDVLATGASYWCEVVEQQLSSK